MKALPCPKLVKTRVSTNCHPAADFYENIPQGGTAPSTGFTVGVYSGKAFRSFVCSFARWYVRPKRRGTQVEREQKNGAFLSAPRANGLVLVDLKKLPIGREVLKAIGGNARKK